MRALLLACLCLLAACRPAASSPVVLDRVAVTPVSHPGLVWVVVDTLRVVNK